MGGNPVSCQRTPLGAKDEQQAVHPISGAERETTRMGGERIPNIAQHHAPQRSVSRSSIRRLRA
jgi:hypothetical protein